MGLAFYQFPGEGGGTGVKPHAGDGVDEPEEFGVLCDFGVDDDALFGGESFEGFDEPVGAGTTCPFLGRVRWVSRRCVLRDVGDFVLFYLVFKEGEEHLVVVHRFALGSIDAGEEGGDDALLKFQFLAEVGDFGGKTGDFLGEVGDLLIFAFDGFLIAWNVPDWA